MTPRRVKLLKLAAADWFWRDHWREALTRAGRVAFFRGQGARGWKATAEWFMRPDTVARILEGEYDGRALPVRPPTPQAAAGRAEQAARTRDCETCAGAGLVTVPDPRHVRDGVWYPRHTVALKCPCTGSPVLDAYAVQVPDWRALLRSPVPTEAPR